MSVKLKSESPCILIHTNVLTKMSNKTILKSSKYLRIITLHL